MEEYHRSLERRSQGPLVDWRSAEEHRQGWIAAALICSSCHEELRTELSELFLQFEIGLQVCHHVAKFAEGEGLITVAQGLLRRGMHLYQQAIRTYNGRRARQQRNETANASRVTGI